MLNIIHNYILITGLLSWCLAQIFKTITHLWVYKEFDFKRLLGDGGMPSGHSAVVTSVALMCGFVYGFDSGIFAVAGVLAIVVMHDATGVRLETGKQAKVINDLSKEFERLFDVNIDADVKLKEFVGHTHMQVFVGAILGVIMAVISYLIFY